MRQAGGRAGGAVLIVETLQKINNKEKEGEVSFEESFKIKSPRERKKNCDLVKC